MAVEFPEDHGL